MVKHHSQKNCFMRYHKTKSNPVLKSVCILHALIHPYTPSVWGKRIKMVGWDEEIQHVLRKVVLLVSDQTSIIPHREAASYNSTLNYRASHPSRFKRGDQLSETEFLFLLQYLPPTSLLNYQTTAGLAAPSSVHVLPPGVEPGGQAAPAEPNADLQWANVQN